MSETENEPEEPIIGRVVAERYRIVRRLGRGGMGAVYLAEHVRMHKPFAVKILHKEMSYITEAVFRFEREAVASGRVDHPNLVSAMDFGKLDDGSLYLVLEYLPGTSLGDVIEQGPMPVTRALAIASQMGQALAAVHAAGIVHRDLKPDNVMLIDKDGADFVKLLDFGMAKVHMERPSVLPEVTQAGIVFGTPRYMAPEQAAGAPTDHRADLYSLGTVLYAMLSGGPPFTADDIKDVLHMQRFEAPPALSGKVDVEVRALVSRLLAKSPDERPQSAEDTVREIEALRARLGGGSLLDRVAARLQTPLGAVAVATIVLVAFVSAYVGSRGLEKPVASAAVSDMAAPVEGAPPRAPEVPDANLSRLLDRVEVGEEAAWREAEERDGGRGGRYWYVLGVARCSHGKWLSGVQAYQRAVRADQGFADDPRLLTDLLKATDDAQAWETAVRFAATLPTPAGADLLFDVWASTPKETGKTALAKRLLESNSVRRRASKAVEVALDLRNSRLKDCEKRAQLLPRAIQHADTRSLRPLLTLASRDGCGARKNQDCFPCLRGDDSLERAIDAAKSRTAPDYSQAGP